MYLFHSLFGPHFSRRFLRSVPKTDDLKIIFRQRATSTSLGEWDDNIVMEDKTTKVEICPCRVLVISFSSVINQLEPNQIRFFTSAHRLIDQFYTKYHVGNSAEQSFQSNSTTTGSEAVRKKCSGGVSFASVLIDIHPVDRRIQHRFHRRWTHCK